ncbi:beta-glucoside-specific PTS transporter subunit IIABC [Paenibacillus donghaensis]|nr:beta-glucoside-specific PTS transporter subunit IIABC [Paenibacillus donghaensis]
MDRTKLASEIIKNVGGKDNVGSVIHCMTRLRFTLNDNSKVNEAELKQLQGVMGATDNGGQYQVIIGNDVPLVFQEVAKQLPTNPNDSVAHTTGNEKKKMNVFLQMINVLSSTMAPIVPALAGAGILKVILTLLVMAGILETTDPTHYYISFFADTVFYFLPFLLAFSSASKFKVNPYLAVSIAGIMLHPKFGELVAAKEPSALFGLPVTLINYSSTVLPIIITVWIMSYIERFADKVSPSVIKIFFKPLLVIIITAPLALIVIGPLGYHMGNGLAAGIYFLQDRVGWLSLALLAAFKPLIVMTGMHWAFTPAIITSISTYGYDGLMLVSSLSAIFSLTGACLAVAIRTKDSNMRQIALSAGTTSLLAGITEPAIFGVAFKLKRVLVATIIGGGLSGVYAGITQLKIFALVTPSILKLPTFVSEEYPNNFMNAIITATIALVVSFVMTLVLGLKENVPVVQAAGAVSETVVTDTPPAPAVIREKTQTPVYSPLNGQSVHLSQVNDKVFSEEFMGKGIAVIPTDGTVVSPVKGTVTTLTKSKHAISITSDEGIEVLIHIGLDTVKLKGKHFENLVAVGQEVNVGDLLIEFDLEGIKNDGFEIITPIIITNTSEYLDVIGNEKTGVCQGDELISVL